MEPSKESVEAFIKEYGELREKHLLDFVGHPQFIPTERGTWELRITPQVVAVESGIPSPFIPN